MAVNVDDKIKRVKARWEAAAYEVKNIDAAGQCALTDETKIVLFKALYRTLEKYYTKSEELWEELQDLYDASSKSGDFPSPDDKEAWKKVRSSYRTAHISMEKLQQHEESGNQAQHASSNITLSDSRTSTYLPRINLPKFDGQLSSWPKFRDIFSSIVDRDPHLSNMEKFHYLTSSLIGNASSIISSFPLEEQNYALAWQSLLDVYDNKRLLANSYLKQLLQFKPTNSRANVDSLMQFLSKIGDTISAFKLIDIPDRSEFILFFLAFRCLDAQTKEQFELANKNVTFPTFDNLIKFVRGKCTALQLAEGNPDAHQDGSKGVHYKTQFQKSRTSLLSNDTRGNTNNEKIVHKCFLCPEKHPLKDCVVFNSLTPKERVRKLQNFKGCTNCLNMHHTSNNCRSKWNCRFCSKRHNSLLHIFPDPAQPSPSTSHSSAMSNISSSSSAPVLNSTVREDSKIQVILGTAVVKFLDSRGQYQNIRIVVDSGSQNSFMTTRCFNKLGLSMQRYSKKISAIGGSIFEGVKGKTSCTLFSADGSSTYSTDAIVVKNITNYLPISPVPYDVWRHYIDFSLADPKFWEPAPVDFLLGSDLYGDVMLGDIKHIRHDFPKLFNSVFGYLVMGKYVDTEPNPLGACLFSPVAYDDQTFDLSKFWELEEPPTDSVVKTLDPDAAAAEESFQTSHYRTDEGRYVVRLPFKQPNLVFPSSYFIAKHRLINLESKLKKNPELSSQYHRFLEEYLSLGHMVPTNDDSKFVIPHHCVSKVDRGEIKLRVVFDGSVKTSLGSLNDHLFVGPALQNDIRDILLNFRAHAVVFVTDAVKMYRQILVDPLDRPYQQILWRFDNADAIQRYNLCTVTYGLSCAPFLALRTLQQLRLDEGANFPLASEVLRRDIYIDDLATGTSSLEGALILTRQVIDLMRRGGFELGKWASNHPELMRAIQPHPAENISEVHWDHKDDTSIKVLGLKWNPSSDCFSYNLNAPPTILSKRGILSTVARVFDPLGFLGPFMLLMKSFIQELWKLRLDWDDEIPSNLANDWQQLIQELDLLSNIHVPRFVVSAEAFQFQIVGFCDASLKGYCGALYIRTITSTGIASQLLTAKTKLAPVKAVSIPRLELCGAHLLAKLYHSIQGFLQLLPATGHPPTFFSDSTIVLGWLRTPTYRLKTFVGNRVSQIAELTDLSLWRHVNTHDNPSDWGSRGCLPRDLIHNSMWWSGPGWLSQPERTWPSEDEMQHNSLPELKAEPISVLISIPTGLQFCISWMERISSYEKLIRIVAFITQAMYNRLSSPSNSKRKSYIQFKEAEKSCVKAVQRFYFFEGLEPSLLKIPSKFSSLNPFIDSNGLLRVGGRLTNSNLPEFWKQQILLPPQAHLTHLIVEHYHKLLLHPGPNLQQAVIQTRFWIPAARRLIRQRTFSCLKCYKSKAKLITPMMGDLPTYRVEGGRAFLHVGVDFAGPFTVKESHRRKAPCHKSYLGLFVCMATKALHLEIVSNQSTDAFLAAFSRLISRRGYPSDVYSDCGSNFKGAARELKELLKLFNEEHNKQALQTLTASQGVNWHFNPPYSPHFGGLWEAGVKAVKRHLYLAAGNAVLTFEELGTLFCQIEAILNSRPLCPLSTDPSEANYLTPGHFLVGSNLTTYPEPSLLDVHDNRLSRWQLIKKLSTQIWKRWHLEYLNTLQARNKWRKPTENLRVGDLVLIKSADTPVLQWPTAKVLDTHPGADGTVRVVTLKTPASVYKRTVANLIPLLPINQGGHSIATN